MIQAAASSPIDGVPNTPYVDSSKMYLNVTMLLRLNGFGYHP